MIKKGPLLKIILLRNFINIIMSEINSSFCSNSIDSQSFNNLIK